MQWIYLALFLAVALGLCGAAIIKRRTDAPLRIEARAHPVLWSLAVTASVRASRPSGWEIRGRGMVNLNLRGGFIETSRAMPLGSLFGMQWYFRSRDVTMEVVQGGLLQGPGIALKGQSAGYDVRMVIWDRNWLPAVWSALVADGVTPIGPPPASQRRLPGA